MRTILTIVCLAVAALLQGCISSDKPLLVGRTDMPLEDGNYVGGKDIPLNKIPDTLVVKRRMDDYFVTKTVYAARDGQPPEETKTSYTITFQQLDEGHYVAQLHEVMKTATPYQYLFVFFNGDAIEFYAARCDVFAKSIRLMKAYDMVPNRDRPGCVATSTAGLLDFMRDFALVVNEITSLEYTIKRAH